MLGHGSGGKLTADLIEKVFLPAFRNPTLDKLDDQAVLKIGDARLAFTTDSFVVTPIFFPGGDIGRLAVHGTVNDLAMSGARPLYLSAAFILEEGLPDRRSAPRGRVHARRRRRGRRPVRHRRHQGRQSRQGRQDLHHHHGHRRHRAGVNISADRARPGDKILLSGYIGDHGMAIMSQREGLEFEGAIESDCAPLNGLVGAMLATSIDRRRDFIHCLRDPTRGGVATTLNEIAKRAKVGMLLDERRIPVRESVQGACEVLGLDPLYVANEGKLLAIVCARDG